jgi:hypothetical protein
MAGFTWTRDDDVDFELWNAWPADHQSVLEPRLCARLNSSAGRWQWTIAARHIGDLIDGGTNDTRSVAQAAAEGAWPEARRLLADQHTGGTTPVSIRTTRKRALIVECIDDRECARLIIRHLVGESEGDVIASTILTPMEAFSVGHALMSLASRYGIDQYPQGSSAGDAPFGRTRTEG